MPAFAYNYRHRTTSVTYGVPSGLAATPDVTYTYDAAGNRTSVTDGMGAVIYHYDLADPQTFNRYVYVRNDPLNYVDPDGSVVATTRSWGDRLTRTMLDT